MGVNTELLRAARTTRRNLEQSARWAGRTSLRDAVHVAADNMRQTADERRWSREP